MPDPAPPKRCVIADDVRSSREAVGVWLRECGFECLLSEDGKQAWDNVESQPPDLLITDLEMPNLCGLELLEKIRGAEDERINQVPVLVMTSLQDGQTSRVVQQMGGDGLLQKPLDKQSTLAVILELVSGRHSFRPILQPRDDFNLNDNGKISPTLRRLLITVAKNR